jgi:hypothetical protein
MPGICAKLPFGERKRTAGIRPFTTFPLGRLTLDLDQLGGQNRRATQTTLTQKCDMTG